MVLVCIPTPNIIEPIFIATNGNQVDSIKTQINDHVNLVVEPERRNTYPAIALAVSKLLYEYNCSEDEVVIVLPIDPYAENKYFELLQNLEIVMQKKTDICLMGVKPTYPSEKYGYIVPSQRIERIRNTEIEVKYQSVNCFKEKPTVEAAKKLIGEGALWNCGIFAFKIGYLLNQLREEIIFNNYEDVLAAYGELEAISFDYKVVEKAESVVVVEYDGIWKDLGTWNTLCDHVTEPVTGNVVLSETSQNTHVINELDIPTIVLGMKDTVVVATHDGILVSDKGESSYLKKYLADKAMRPMYEKRQWGKYTVLDNGKCEDGLQVITKKLQIISGKNISYQYHEHRSETWAIIEGSGFFVLNDKVYSAKPGNVFKIKVGDKHAIRAVEDITLIEIQTGSSLIEDDIKRIEKNWDKILLLCKLPEIDDSFNGE